MKHPPLPRLGQSRVRGAPLLLLNCLAVGALLGLGLGAALGRLPATVQGLRGAPLQVLLTPAPAPRCPSTCLAPPSPSPARPATYRSSSTRAPGHHT